MRLKQNKELYRLKKSDYAPLESVFTDYLSGKVGLTDLLKVSRHTDQRNSNMLVESMLAVSKMNYLTLFHLPIKRIQRMCLKPCADDARRRRHGHEGVDRNGEHGAVNHFQMFLALSDSMINREGEFLHWPHTTRVMWAVLLLPIFSQMKQGR